MGFTIVISGKWKIKKSLPCLFFIVAPPLCHKSMSPIVSFPMARQLTTSPPSWVVILDYQSGLGFHDLNIMFGQIQCHCKYCIACITNPNWQAIKLMLFVDIVEIRLLPKLLSD